MKKKKKFYLLLQNGETLMKEASGRVRVSRLVGKENVLAIMPVAEDEDIDDSVDKMMSNSGEFLDGIYAFKIIDLVRGHSKGFDNLPPCTKIDVTFRLYSDNCYLDITDDFYLDKMDKDRIDDILWSVGFKRDKGNGLDNLNVCDLIGKKGVCYMKCYESKTRSGDIQRERRITKFFDYNPYVIQEVE